MQEKQKEREQKCEQRTDKKRLQRQKKKARSASLLALLEQAQETAYLTCSHTLAKEAAEASQA
jgi:hypothetical protein